MKYNLTNLNTFYEGGNELIYPEIRVELIISENEKMQELKLKILKLVSKNFKGKLIYTSLNYTNLKILFEQEESDKLALPIKFLDELDKLK